MLTEPQPKPKYRPVEPKVLPSETEEPLTEEEMEVTETEITEPLTASPKLESEPEMDRSELVEEIEADEKGVLTIILYTTARRLIMKSLQYVRRKKTRRGKRKKTRD